MVSMKCDEAATDKPLGNDYGYGLQICLNDDQCEALGIKEPLRAGVQVKITALAFVKHVTESTEDDGDDAGNDISLCLQITYMALTGHSTSNPAKTLYGE